MSRLGRLGAVLAGLALLLAGCSEQKATGLPTGPTPEPEPVTNVKVLDNFFEPQELTIKPGEEVTWVFEGAAPHNVKAVAGSFDSHPKCVASETSQCSKPGAPDFKRVFPKAGEFAYYCVIHGSANGVGMAGTVTVKA